MYSSYTLDFSIKCVQLFKSVYMEFRYNSLGAVRAAWSFEIMGKWIAWIEMKAQ